MSHIGRIRVSSKYFSKSVLEMSAEGPLVLFEHHEAEVGRAVEKLQKVQKERTALKKTIHLMCANLGNPDAALGVRLALRTSKHALEDNHA